MFRFADIGRVWVRVDLPRGFGPDGEEAGSIHLLQDIFKRKELREREQAATITAAQKLVDSDGKVKSINDLRAVFDEVYRAEAETIDELVKRTHDWRGIEAEYSAERFAGLLEHDWFFKAARTALYETSREGKRKNSPPGPDGTPARDQA